MTEEQIQRLIDLAEEELAKEVTQEEARLSLQRAGILDENFELMPHYQTLPYGIEMFPNRYK
jgi:hypothetical protein